MKFNKFWTKPADETIGVRYCKECENELASTNKDKLCDDCRRKKASNIRNIAGVAGTILLAGLGLLIKNSVDDKSEKES